MRCPHLKILGLRNALTPCVYFSAGINVTIMKTSTKSLASTSSINNSESFKAHGLGLELVKPTWAPLTLTEINNVLHHFTQLGSAREIVWHSPRPFSSGALVATANKPVFIKRHHHSVRDASGLHEEHRFISHLQAACLPVPEVLRDDSGSSVVAHGEWTYEVHAQAAGVDLYRDTLSWSPFFSTAHAQAAGCALAQLHLAAVGYQAPERQSKVLVSSTTLLKSADLIESITQFINLRPALAKYLAKRQWHAEISRDLMPAHTKLKPFIKALPPLWTHNDWHASNLLWSDASDTAGVASIIDFGLSNKTFALYDLATAIERNVIEWLVLPSESDDLVHFDLLDALLEGYTSIRPLSALEIKALPLLLPLVHIEFALSEVLYFNSVAPSPENIELAYDGYFLGHLKWFKTAAGQHLLNHLKQRCLSI